jgi:tRNA(His) 5'-end guanylyltransferase
MTDKTTLGDRMKQYEATTQTQLLRRTPVIIRIDGRAFHTYTRRFVASKYIPPDSFDAARMSSHEVVDPSLQKTPFSAILHELMTGTASALFNDVQNCVLSYTQSDEISLLLRDWDRHETQQWFNGNVQKIVSVSASIATAMFNHYALRLGVKQHWFGDMAQFDCRVYNIPKDEVVNYFIWRQQDASRNSVQQLARFYFSHKQLHQKNNSEIQDMLMLEKGVNWNDLATWMKRGACVYTRPDWSPVMSFGRAFADNEPPIFTQDRNYVEQHLTATAEDFYNAEMMAASKSTKPQGDNNA